MKSKKTILLFIDWYLPGYKAGGPIQSCANLVNHLNEEFNFKIITRNTDYCESQPYPNILSNEWCQINENTSVYYLSADKTTKTNIHHLIKSTAFDIVYLNGVLSYYFTIVPLLYFRKVNNKKIIVAARGMLAPGALAIKSKKKKLFFIVSKILNLFHKVIFHATNEAEKQDIINVFGNKNEIKIAGNLSKKITIPNYLPKSKQAGNLKLVNIARVAPEKNLKFALEILKEVKTDVTFDFYGPVYDEKYFNECLSVLNSLPVNVKASYKNVIPNEKVYETLSQYHALLMPTLGENFGHIILESLIAACPVIISDQTPWQNLESEQSGWDISLNQKHKFAEAIEVLAATNEKEYNVYSHSAYKKAKDFVENQSILEANKALFE